MKIVVDVLLDLFSDSPFCAIHRFVSNIEYAAAHFIEVIESEDVRLRRIARMQERTAVMALKQYDLSVVKSLVNKVINDKVKPHPRRGTENCSHTQDNRIDPRVLHDF